MTIRELKKKLEKIPPTGAINRARRMAIIEMINRLQAGGNA